MPVVGIWVCILRHKCPWNMSGIPTVSDALKVQITISITHLTLFFSGEDYDKRGNNRKKRQVLYVLLFVETKIY